MPSPPPPSFPSGVIVHSSLGLVTWHPRGLLDAALAREILHFMEHEERTAPEPFHRFADLSAIDAVQLRFTDIEEIAEHRVGGYQGVPVKSAILALHPLAFGMARMYEQLMRRRSPIKVRVFSELSSAATWLEMPVGALSSGS